MRAAAALIEVGFGPVSISAALPPSRTRIASPCPTSSTTSSSDATPDEPLTTKRNPHPSAKHVTMRATLGAVGAGHAHQRAAPTSALTIPHAMALPPTGMAACGTPARKVVTRATIPRGSAANLSISIPAAGTARYSMAPATPRPSETDASGKTVTLATGPITDTMLKAGIATGAVEACATTGVTNERTGLLSFRPATICAHSEANAENTINPATALTERAKPISKACGGECSRTKHTAMESDDRESVRLPDKLATTAAAVIRRARTAETGAPVNRT